ncbi:class I SAM-dependent DNA methyltransferase [Liquorilactobacillus capillatus]|uniref:Putative methyltransferase (Putative) n=1 Tax=Liquorilactobacillus capillatus DSM 19910 TaxID=1423731 RepID=A0A0R1M566_9LACO|nr:class I SAM-dependent methyltransferase [Liquorilactobacillus capillatus]KRL03212.1 putative methyltransferase (putative) [Liquorilactobacillus capillatus DSM 19910]
MIYTTFAQLYDELMEPEMYRCWEHFIEQQVPKLETASILDLACGTGRLAILLAQKGYHVTGSDLSSDMLALAEERARNAHVTLPLVEANMLVLNDLAQFDVITCCLDSLCYLENKKAMQTVFEQVFAHLHPNGTFIFDVISPHQTDVVYPGYMYNYTDEERAFIWESYSGEKSHSVVHDLTFFVYDELTNGYTRLSETHHERTYPLADYMQMLNAAGFKEVSKSASFGQKEISQSTDRWFFVCHKK